jgi:hypothetical protein
MVPVFKIIKIFTFLKEVCMGVLNEKQKKLLSALIESVEKGETITYGELAEKSGFTPIGVGTQLGAIGEYLEQRKYSPILNSIAISKSTGIPSGGLGRFFCGYENLSKTEKEILVLLLQKCVFSYGKWKEIDLEEGE